MDKQCIKCSVDLIVGDNWRASSKKHYVYKCNSCRNNKSTQWQNENPNLTSGYLSKQRNKEGVGVYQVILNNICLYVGEGQIYERKNKHLRDKNEYVSNVYAYCNKHNINRKLLSFNVLEYENDKTIRKQKEDWYITFLTPVINPKPPLGLYV